MLHGAVRALVCACVHVCVHNCGLDGIPHTLGDGAFACILYGFEHLFIPELLPLKGLI